VRTVTFRLVPYSSIFAAGEAGLGGLSVFLQDFRRSSPLWQLGPASGSGRGHCWATVFLRRIAPPLSLIGVRPVAFRLVPQSSASSVAEPGLDGFSVRLRVFRHSNRLLELGPASGSGRGRRWATVLLLSVALPLILIGVRTVAFRFDPYSSPSAAAEPGLDGLSVLLRELGRSSPLRELGLTSELGRGRRWATVLFRSIAPPLSLNGACKVAFRLIPYSFSDKDSLDRGLPPYDK